MLSIFLALAFLSLGKAQLTCKDSLVNAPFSLKGVLAPNQNCQWTIVLSESDDLSYPLVNLTVNNIGSTDTVTLRSGNEGDLEPPSGQNEFVMESALLPVNFLTFHIKTQSSSSLTVDISITQEKANLTKNQKESTLNEGEQAVTIPLKTATTGETYAFSSNFTGNVSIALMAHPAPEESSKLMGFFIYEGEELKGSLYQYLNKPYISESNDVSIFIASEQTTAKSLVLIQNADNLDGVNSFATRWQYALDEEGQPKEMVIPVTGTYKEPAILTIGRGDDDTTDCYLTDIDLESSSSQVYVYAGTFADDQYKLERYDYSNVKTNLPQQLPGPLKTFVVYGAAKITLVPNVSETAWEEAYIGRKGFLMTENYPFDREAESITLHLVSENATEKLYFTMDAPKGDTDAYWYIMSDEAGKSGGATEPATITGTRFNVTLRGRSSGSTTGALAAWSITEIPTTTTTTTTTTVPTPESTTGANETTTDWSQTTENITDYDEISTPSGTENPDFTTPGPATTTPKSTTMATVSLLLVVLALF